jgi:hypothetical protein
MIFMAGAANSMVFLPLQTSMFTSIAPADTGDASAIFNACRQTSLALGVAILSTVVASVGGDSFAAFHTAYVAAALIALAGGAAAFAMIHGDARADDWTGGSRTATWPQPWIGEALSRGADRNADPQDQRRHVLPGPHT